MELTKLIYLENFNLLQDKAILLQITHENTKDVIILNQTIFYPQGGGQPYDKGIIENLSAKFIVEKVRLDTRKRLPFPGGPLCRVFREIR